MNRLPPSVFATLVLILLNAAFWLVFAFVVVFGHLSAFAPMGAARWILAGLALGVSGVLAGLALFLRRRLRLAFYAGVALLALLAILSLTDEVGWPDLAMLLISLVTLGLMLKDRAWYLALPTRR